MAKKNTDTINYRILPASIARLMNGVRIALNGTVNGNVLSNETGISHSEIYRLRSGKRKVSRLSLRSCILLASYPDYSMRKKYTQEITKQVYTAIDCGISIHQMAYRSGVPENTLYKLHQSDKHSKSGHIFNVMNISIVTLAKIIHCYDFAKKHHLLHYYKTHKVSSTQR